MNGMQWKITFHVKKNKIALNQIPAEANGLITGAVPERGTVPTDCGTVGPLTVGGGWKFFFENVFFMTNPIVIFVFYFGEFFSIFLIMLFFLPKITIIPLFGCLEQPLLENCLSVRA
jgi:hypothetical protein